jgi:rubrerythrin
MTVSRRKLLLVAGSSVLAAPLLAACGDDAGGGEGDEVAVLGELLTLEHVQADFYAALVESKIFPPKAAEALGRFGEEEEEHAAALRETIERLGGEPPARPKIRFSLQGETETLKAASELENLGAAAYLGQLPNVRSRSTLETLVSIHSVEGRHAAAINTLLGEPASPDGAFAKPITAKAALAKLDSYLA